MLVTAAAVPAAVALSEGQQWGFGGEVATAFFGLCRLAGPTLAMDFNGMPVPDPDRHCGAGAFEGEPRYPWQAHGQPIIGSPW